MMHDRAAILEDTAAIRLLGPPLSTILRIAPLRWLFWRPLLAKVRPISVFIVVRSRGLLLFLAFGDEATAAKVSGEICQI
jgi:hypothetical protein